MAEESPRPETEEESEEEGEEATEAPGLNDVKTNKVEVPRLKERKAEATAVPEKASPPSAVAQPLFPTPPSLRHAVTAYPIVHPASPSALYTSAAPALPSTTSGVNVFANDGSFLELFKKKMEQSPTGSKEEAATREDQEPDKRKPITFVGKRRGGAKLALKTGLVAKKPKTDDEEVVVQKGGAWAQYMAEVKKYKAHQCSDDDKTRPLVK